MNVSETQTQLTNAKAQLTQLETAIAAILDPTVRSYSIDTGQTVQTLRRHDLPDLYESIASLENRICTLTVRLAGSGGALGVPAW